MSRRDEYLEHAEGMRSMGRVSRVDLETLVDCLAIARLADEAWGVR